MVQNRVGILLPVSVRLRSSSGSLNCAVCQNNCYVSSLSLCGWRDAVHPRVVGCACVRTVGPNFAESISLKHLL